MRVALVALGDGQSDRLRKASRAVLGSLGSKGYEAELFSAGEGRVSYFDFVFVLAEPKGSAKSFRGFLDEKLGAGANFSGKRSMALLLKAGFRPGKALSSLMAAMERQGMVVTMGEIAANEAEAAALALEAPVVRG